MIRPQFSHVLNSDYPYLNWELEGDYKYEKIQWHLSEGQTPPSKEELESKLTALQTEYDSKQYQRDRLAEYPSIQELVVALYDADDKAEIDKKRAEIKKKYPKPE